ncbi:MAG: sporulation transcriptional regulator SpoIIID [Clostridia bacterium]|nr:sporulation transcriptional regulator SpoIIID [Clostridia bacterium]
MNAYIENRVMDIAGYIIETGATVRTAAKEFGVSKSTVHKDMTDRLRRLDRGKAKDVAAVLETNKEERHIRGGYATYLKYRNADKT